jgi:hypothetical protein
MLRRAGLVRTDVSEERCAFVIRVTRIGELGTTLSLTSNRRTLRRNISSLISISIIITIIISRQFFFVASTGC